MGRSAEGTRNCGMTVSKGQMKSPPAAQRKTSCHRGFLAALLKQGAEW